MSLLTYNIEGLNTLYQLDVRMYISNFDVIVLTETFTSKFPDHLFPLHKVFVSDGVKLSDAPTARLCGGIAMLVRKTFEPFINQIHMEYDNCVVLKLSSELTGFYSDCVLIGIYLPPKNSTYYSDTDIYNGVSLLESCILDVLESRGDLPFIIIGDLNARTGSMNASEDDLPVDIIDMDNVKDNDVCLYRRVSDDTVINDFGQYLLCVCEEFNLTILNGILSNNMDGSYTYISPNGSSSIDYCIMSQSIFDKALSLVVGQRIESKHMPVEVVILSKVKYHNRLSKKKSVVQRFKWDCNKYQEYMNMFNSEQVVLQLREAFDLIDSNLEDALKKFYNAITLAASPMLKTVVVGTFGNQPWFDKECRQTRQSVRLALRKLRQSKENIATSNKDVDVLRIYYTNSRKEYKSLLKQKQTDYKNQTLKTLIEDMNNPKQFWSTLKDFLGKPMNQCIISKEEWFDHFSNIFQDECPRADLGEFFSQPNFVNNYSSVDADYEILDQAITHQEVLNAISALKDSKAAGPDGFSGEFYKYASPELALFLTSFFNKLFETGSFPYEWSEAIIQPIHKKGDRNCPDNFRGISLLSVCGKLYSYILNKRLTDWVEKRSLLNETQAGFRKNYSTTDHIFTLLSLIQKQFSGIGKLYCAFIDFRKAFDLVDRSCLWAILKRNGIDGKMYRAIQSMYNVVKARVRVGGDLTDYFMCPKGLRQGDICSPVLFSLFINELAQEITFKGKHGITLTPEQVQLMILLFADDVLLLSHTVIGLQQQLNILNDTASRLGLEVNMDKSKIIVFGKGGYLSAREKWVYNGHNLDVVNQYKYLGVIFSTGLSFSFALKDMADRARKGVIGILRLLWSFGNQSPRLFFKLFDCQIQPILTYGSEVWGLITDFSIIERVHLFAIKRYLNVSIRTPNALVYGESGRYPLFINIHVRQIKYWITLTRMSEDRIPRKCYWMLYNLHCRNKNNWVSSVCFTLYRYGFGFVWEQQGVSSIRNFLVEFRQRLVDCYVQGWNYDIRTNERYTFYSSLKQSHCLSEYLSQIHNGTIRKCLTRLRLGVSPLRCHACRFYGSSGNAFDCPFCPGDHETEYHFMIICPKYRMLRKQFIPLKFYNHPCMFRLVLLLSSSRHLVAVAMYIHKALQLRSLDMC